MRHNNNIRDNFGGKTGWKAVPFKSLVRSNLEYANAACNPHRLGLIKDLEKVQMRASKLVITIKNLTYKDRLKRLKLPTVKYGHVLEVIWSKYTRSWLMKDLKKKSCDLYNEVDLYK